MTERVTPSGRSRPAAALLAVALALVGIGTLAAVTLLFAVVAQNLGLGG